MAGNGLGVDSIDDRSRQGIDGSSDGNLVIDRQSIGSSPLSIPPLTNSWLIHRC